MSSCSIQPIITKYSRFEEKKQTLREFVNFELN